MTQVVLSGSSVENLNKKWKKDELQVSFQMLKGCWRRYQATAKDAKREHLSDIILSNLHNPRVLFNTVDIVLNSPQTACIELSPVACEKISELLCG